MHQRPQGCASRQAERRDTTAAIPSEAKVVAALYKRPRECALAVTEAVPSITNSTADPAEMPTAKSDAPRHPTHSPAHMAYAASTNLPTAAINDAVSSTNAHPKTNERNLADRDPACASA
jgi:hypothetical protein